MGGFWGGFLGGLLVVLLFGRHPHQASATEQLAAMAEIRRQQMTETDIMNEKQIATAVEEFSVDNGGKYPPHLADLKPPYLSGARYVPGSDPPVTYIYEQPAADPSWGPYDIRDDGSLDPILDKLLNVKNRQRCTKATCKYIIDTQAFGIVGSPYAVTPNGGCGLCG
jgi:hypothetical protein